MLFTRLINREVSSQCLSMVCVMLSCMLCILASCADNDMDFYYISSGFNGNLKIRDKKNIGLEDDSFTLAKERDIVFEIPKSYLSDFRKDLGSHSMFVARLGPDPQVGPNLLSHQGIEAVYHKPNQGGIALLLNPQAKTLLSLAGAAHKHSHALPCGQIEIIPNLSLSAAARPERTHIYPIYDEHIRLKEIEALIDDVSLAHLERDISLIANGPSRVHNSSSGVKLPKRLADLIKERTKERIDLKFEIMKLNPALTNQSNLRVVIPGMNDQLETVIIGAHMDSITGGLSTDNAPGADDDASGIAVILEILEVLAARVAKFQRQIEFHLYGAEEIGLVGSMAMAEKFYKENNKVVAMLQLDMTSFVESGASQHIYFVENDTSPVLRRSLKSLMTAYEIGSYRTKSISGGTSDHKSWTVHGFPSVFPFEDPDNFNRTIHSENDRVDLLNFEFAGRFAKLGLAFLGHEAGLIDGGREYDAKIAAEVIQNDISLAIFNGVDQEKTPQLRAAAHVKAVSIELCYVSLENRDRCVSDLEVLPLKYTRGGRSFFEATQSYLQSPATLGLFAYDQNDRLLARRIVEIQ